MADTNHLRRDDYVEFSENDPFAELTRIMGHDPRAQDEAPQAESSAAPATSAPVAPALDDFSFDLEKELAGDFDFSDFDDQAPVTDWRAEPAAPAPAQEETREEEGAADALDAGFDTFFADADEEPQAAAPEEAAAFAPDDTLDALERELFSTEEAWTAEPEPEVAAYAPAPEWTNDEPAAPEPAAPEPAAYAAEIREAEAELAETDVAETGEAEESWAKDAEFDLDFLEAELEASAAQGAIAPQTSAAHEPAAYEPVAFGQDDAYDEPRASVEPPSLSLEEELSLLLADDPVPAPVSPPVSSVAMPPVSAPSVTEPSYEAAPRGTYGLANYAAAAAPAAVAATASSFFAQPQATATPAYEPAAEATLSPGYDEARHEEAVHEQVVHEGAGPQGLFDDDFDFDLTLDEETPEPVAAVPAASAAALPEIETVEVAETVQPVADDLDIPDIDYGTRQEAAPAPFDEFEAEFADVFGELTPDEPAVAAAPASAAAAAPAQPEIPPYMLDDAQWQAAQDFPETDLDYESDLERAIASSAYDESEERPAPRRRGVMVAAAAVGVAVLGGLGVFGMSMLGGGTDTPALVRADPEPMKVRPENPGGTTVPNQNSEVYQRVAGGGASAAPEQEKLISSAEEPVDVAARTAAPQEPEVLAPGIDDEAEAGQFKSEDRIEPEAETAPVAGETTMVTPRRVRTMVVRPDGTMVPREEVAPAQEAAADQLVAAAPQLAAPAAALETAPEAVPSAEPDDGPTIDMPQTVAVVPTQRVEPRAAAPAAQPAAAAPVRPAAPAPAPVATQASAPAAAAPAAAGGGWSMQIASQPTAESAQSAYQDLARRYGSVLQGRGVNIVRADIDGRGTYYRVRIPASGRDEAIQLCTRYKAAGGSCFVSR